MPSTASLALNEFRSDTVDLDPDDTSAARTSRDFLLEQIIKVANETEDFPEIIGDYKPFGSFSRRTKVRPLDDVDLLLFLHGRGGTQIHLGGYIYTAQISDSSAPIWQYTDDSNYVNSTRILNKFKKALESVPNYQRSEIKRTGEAVVLNLVSYDWNFDIVPAFKVAPFGEGGIMYYLIPDGNGNWKHTDPRIDQDLITSTNQQHNEHFIPLVRLIKYWNVYTHSPPRLMSYYLETLLINTFKAELFSISNVKTAIPKAFRGLANRVMLTCPDPKNLGPNLDASADWDTRIKVRDAAEEMAKFADYAIMYENNGDQKNAIYWWDRIFPNFPPYDG